jgi:hypothetical protein
MFDPLLLFAATTGGMGIAAVVAGRPVRGWPNWPLGRRGFRVAGAVCLVESLLAFSLAVTHNDGIAFLVFSIGALSMAATIHVVQRRGPSI